MEMTPQAGVGHPSSSAMVDDSAAPRFKSMATPSPLQHRGLINDDFELDIPRPDCCGFPVFIARSFTLTWLLLLALCCAVVGIIVFPIYAFRAKDDTADLLEVVMSHTNDVEDYLNAYLVSTTVTDSVFTAFGLGLAISPIMRHVRSVLNGRVNPMWIPRGCDYDMARMWYSGGLVLLWLWSISVMLRGAGLALWAYTAWNMREAARMRGGINTLGDTDGLTFPAAPCPRSCFDATYYDDLDSTACLCMDQSISRVAELTDSIVDDLGAAGAGVILEAIGATLLLARLSSEATHVWVDAVLAAVLPRLRQQRHSAAAQSAAEQGSTMLAPPAQQ